MQMVSSSLALLNFFLGFHGGRQGSGPDRGRSPVEWGYFPYVRSHPPLGPPAARSEPQTASQPDLSLQAWLAEPQAWLDGPEGGDKETDVRTENIPILQDFVPYWGRCPKKRYLVTRALLRVKVGMGLNHKLLM